MMAVYLALYKGEGDFVNSFIRWKTKSPYSHCELLVDGWIYSSTVRDGGVRAKLSILDSSHWDFIPILWTNEETVIKYYLKTKGKPYGWLDLALNQVFKLPSSDHKGDFCSEWCAKALGLPDPQQFTPDMLGRIVKWANENYNKK